MSIILVRAPDSAQAMEEVLRRLGPDAYILSTRTHAGMVEIRATAEPPLRNGSAGGFAQTLQSRIEADATAAAGLRPLDQRSLDEIEQRLIAEMLPSPERPGLLDGAINRIILMGPSGGGKSMVAARLAAAIMRQGRGLRPRLVQPSYGPVLADDRLRGWARMLGLMVDRPRLEEFLQAPRWLPDDEASPQIVDLSELAAISADDLAEMAAPAGARPFLVLPAGLSARRLARDLQAHGASRPELVLTRLDEGSPSLPELALLSRAGLPLALLSSGTSLIEGLVRPTAPEVRRWVLQARNEMPDLPSDRSNGPVLASFPISGTADPTGPEVESTAVPRVVPSDKSLALPEGEVA